MLIKYSGPSKSVNVEPYGAHRKGEVKEYPDKFGEELLETSRKQQFEPVDDGGVIAKSPAPEKMTVPQLKELLDKLKIEYPADAQKKDLVELVKTHTSEPPKE